LKWKRALAVLLILALLVGTAIALRIFV